MGTRYCLRSQKNLLPSGDTEDKLILTCPRYIIVQFVAQLMLFGVDKQRYHAGTKIVIETH